ncbi:RNA polymerase sigma factor [Spirochaetota bacterium]
MAFTGTGKEFREAYSNYYPIVFSSLFSKTGSREDAEDICQEVFIRFLDKFNEIEDKRSWLFTAMRFEISNYYKKKGSKKIDADNIDDVFNDSSLKYENGFRDARIILNDAIEDENNFKNEKEKVLFDLIAVYSFSYKEAAKYLNLTKSKVEYKYKQIEKRIIDFLKSKDIKEIDDLI